MRCEEFEKLLDGEGAATTPEAAAHAASCGSCGRALERWNAARREVRALGDEPAPPFLAARVMAAVHAEGAGRRRAVAAAWWRLRLAPALVVLAVASLGGWALQRALRGGGAQVQETRVAAAKAGTGARDAVLPALADRAAPPPDVPTRAAPIAPATPRRRAAVTTERSGQRPAVPAQAPGFAPEPVVAATEADDTGREQPRPAGSAVGGVLAAAPVAAKAAPPAGEAAANRVDLRVGEAAAVSLDEMKELPAGGVAVRLAAPGGAVVFGGAVDPAAAPPPGTWWRVRVKDGGSLILLDAGGRDIGAAHPGTLSFLRARRLSPGEYRLSR